MFETKMNTQTSSSKASTCKYASFNNAMVMTLSTILVVLILMLIISITPMIRSEILIAMIIISAIGMKSKPTQIVAN